MGAVKVDPAKQSRTIVVNGEEYDATPEAIAELGKRGIQFSEPEKGFWQGMQETVQDFGRGAAHGATFGLADKKFGDSDESIMQRLGGDDYKVVQDRSPTASLVGDVSGSVLSPLSKIGVAAKGAGAAMQIGRAALGAGVEAGTRAYSDGQQDIGNEVQQGAEIGGGVSAATNTLGAMLKSSAAGKAAQGAGRLLDRAADSHRVRGSGFVIKDLKDLARKTGVSGDDLISDTAERIESLAPSPRFGESAADKARTFEGIRMQQGKQIGESLDDMGRTDGLNAFITDSGNGAQPGIWNNLQRRLRGEADAMKGSTVGENANRNAAQGFASRLEQEAAPSSLSGVHGRLHEFGDEAYGMNKANKQVSTLENSSGAQAAEMGRDILRDELGNAVNSYATPQNAQKFNDSMKGFSEVADLERVAKDRATAEAGTAQTLGTFSPVILAGLGGLLSGGSLSAAALGAGMAASSGTRNAIRQMAEMSHGYDAAANLLRTGSKKLGHSKRGPSAARAKMRGLGEALARQGNRRGLLAVEGMLPDDEE